MIRFIENMAYQMKIIFPTHKKKIGAKKKTKDMKVKAASEYVPSRYFSSRRNIIEEIFNKNSVMRIEPAATSLLCV